MKRGDLTAFACRIKGVFDEERLNELGREVKFAKRLRVVTPFRVGLCVVGLFGTRRVETIADVLRGFVALFGESVEYKPFHNQLRKPGFAEFMRAVATMVMKATVARVLESTPQGVLGRFKRIVIQDGTSFALKDGLEHAYPGRFTKFSPAAVELHVTHDVLRDAPARIVLRPDRDGERHELPPPQTLTDALILLDRGYQDKEYFRAVGAAQGSFIARGKRNMNLLVTAAYDEQERMLRRMIGCTMQTLPKLSKSSLTDLDVVVRMSGGEQFSMRVVVFYSQREKCHQYLLTNLERATFAARDISELYRLRWQVELLFKEWKSYANLHAFDTEQEAIAEGFIWASVAAAILKRFFAHAAQALHSVPVSTRRTVMAAPHFLPPLVEALRDASYYRIVQYLERLLAFLANVAQRAHPERDARNGRLSMGLRPCFEALKN